MKTAILGLLAVLTLLVSGAALYYDHESHHPAPVTLVAAAKGQAHFTTARLLPGSGAGEEYASLSRSLAWQAAYCAAAALLLGWWWRDGYRGAGEKLKLILLIGLAALPVGGLWYLGLLRY